jgi:hypothetical protein
MIETSDDPPDQEKAKPIIEKYYVRKMIEENGVKTFTPFKMSDSIEDFQKLGEGVYMYFCFLKFFGIVFVFIGLLMFLPVILMVLEENNSNESKANIFFRTMTANIGSLQNGNKSLTEEERKEHINKIFTIFLWFYFVINILIFLSIVIFRITVKRKRIQLSKSINLNRNQKLDHQVIHSRNYRIASREVKRFGDREILPEYLYSQGTWASYECYSCL